MIAAVVLYWWSIQCDAVEIRFQCLACAFRVTGKITSIYIAIDHRALKRCTAGVVLVLAP